MLGKYSVKKPYTVAVGVILVIILGVISFTNMTTDLLPSMNFPYVIVYTTYIGATPEQVESEVTRPMESAFATLTDVKQISSTSSDNLSLVVLEFNDTADLNTAMIEINSEITTLSATWSDSVGAPAIMKINPDMLPVSIVSVSVDDMDILELSEYVENTLIPEYESINGVASVSASGLITQEVDVTIEQDRIDVLNNAILRDIDAELADAEQQLNDAQAQISDGKNQLARAKRSALAQLDEAQSQLDNGEAQLATAIEQLTAQRDELQTQLDQVNAALEQMEGLVNLTDEQKALLRALEAQMGNLRAEKQRLEEQLAALENGEGGDALRAQREEAVAQRDELVAERTGYEEYIEDLRQADPDALAAEIAALDADIAAAQSELDEAQSDLSATVDARDATQSHVNELKRQIAELQGDSATAAPTATTAPETTATAATTAPEATVTAAPTAPADPETTTDAPDEAGSENIPADLTELLTACIAITEEIEETLANPAMPTDPTTTVNPTTTVAPDATDDPTATDDPATTVDPTTTDDPAAPEPTAATSIEDVLAGLFSARADGKTLEELQSELTAAEAALDELTANVDAAQAEVDERQANLDELTARRSDKQAALDDIEGGNVESRIQAAQREIDKLNLRIAALDVEIQGIDELISSDGASAEALRASIRLLDEAITKIENSDEYKALQLILNDDELNAQYAAALQAKAQLEDGIVQIDSALEKLNRGVIPGGMIEGIDEDTSLADARAQLESGRSQANAGFAEAEAQLNAASAELAEARKEFEEKRDEALENAGLDGVITLQTVASLIGAQNMSMPAGYVYDVSDDEYLVRVGDKFASLDELKNLKLFSIGMDSVDEVRLCDVASVEITDNRAESFTKVDGQDGILLSIEKQSTFSTTDVANRVADRNAELMADVDGLHVVDMFNQGDYINIIVDSVLQNLIYGGLLAVLVLLIFLMDWRPTIIIACSIPISVVAAFVCMYFSGITLNVLSLSGLALGIGMLVDNSIVAIENIYRLHDEEGKPILTACVQGVSSISGALLSSTLTTISVFLPVVFVTGMAHDLFLDIGLTITFSLMASLIVAMTLVPSMAAGLLRRQKKPHKNRFIGIQRGYVKLLGGALRFKPVVLVVAVGLLVFTVMQISKMGVSFMPEVNSTQMTATLEIDPEQDLTEQQDRALEMMNRMMAVDGVSTVGLSGGSGTMSLMGGGGSLTYYIIVDENAGRKNADIAKDIANAASDMGMELGIKTSTMDISMLTGSGIDVDITGEDTDTLRAVAADVTEMIRGVEGTTEISDGMEDAVPEIRITVDKEKATDKNLTVGQVLQFVATKLAGKTEITQATLDGKSLSIYVLDGRNSSITPDTLEDLEIEVTSGNESEMVRIGDIADVTETESFSSIARRDQQRIMTVSFQVADGYSMNHVSDALEAKLAEYEPPEGYTVALSGENETVMGIMGDLVFMMCIAVALIFLIMVAQFQSFKSPVIVMFTIPLAFTGGLIALLITGMDLSIVAMVGFLVLSGVVVNNGIVFVDSVNQLRIAGMSKREALLETGRLRLRPILMTAATTILGMSTMALGTGMGAEMMQPMAVVTIGGLIYATLMTLFVVPVLYDLVNGEKMSAREIDMIREAAGMNKEGGDAPKPDGPDDDPKPPRPGMSGTNGDASAESQKPDDSAEPAQQSANAESRPAGGKHQSGRARHGKHSANAAHGDEPAAQAEELLPENAAPVNGMPNAAAAPSATPSNGTPNTVAATAPAYESPVQGCPPQGMPMQYGYPPQAPVYPYGYPPMPPQYYPVWPQQPVYPQNAQPVPPQDGQPGSPVYPQNGQPWPYPVYPYGYPPVPPQQPPVDPGAQGK